MSMFNSVTDGKKNNGRTKEVVEPVVIDESLIRESIKKYNLENKILNKDNIEFSQLKVLTLSYSNILKIQNLAGLYALEKLDLDNNIIGEIDGLDHLQKLKWLDLSFNCISQITNLDKLTYLTDLALYSNNIAKVENLKELQNLDFLNLGNNQIWELGDMLRQMKKLRNLKALCVANNKISKDQEYKNYVIINLPDLKYVDYEFIDDETREALKQEEEKYRVDQADEEAKEEAKKTEDEELRKMKEAGIEDLYQHEVRILEEPEDLVQCLKFKEFDDTKQKFNESVKNLISNIRSAVFDIQKLKKKIVDKFDGLISALERDAETDKGTYVTAYMKKKKHCDRKIEQGNITEEDLYSEVDTIIVFLSKLDHQLMDREMALSKSIQKVVDDIIDIQFKNIFNDLENAVVSENGLNKQNEIFQEFFTKFSEEAHEFAERLEQRDKTNELKNEAQGGADNDYDDDYDKVEDYGILEGLDELKTNITGIRDAVDARQRNIESKIRGNFTKERAEYTKSVHSRIKENNSKNVQNIIKFIEDEIKYWEEKKNRQVEEEDEED